MERYRPFIFLGLAVIIAVIVSLVITNYLQKRTKVKDVALETQPIAVAKVDLSWGTIIKNEMIEMKPYLKSNLPQGHFSDANSLVGRVLVSNIKANEPILESRLAPTTIKTGGVAAVVSPKKRAISVKVDKVVGVSGFIHPGNRVDVLVTLHEQKAQTTITKIVLENILVLAAGPEVEPKGKGEKPAPVDVITLEVTPEEAEKLALAATEGRILLALRNFTDTEDVITKGITIPALLASYSTPAYVPAKEAKVAKVVPKKALASKKPSPGKAPITVAMAEKKPPHVVELIEGNKLTQVKFERSE